MLPIGQIALGLAQLVKLLLSANILVGIALLGAVAHTAPLHADSGAQALSTSHLVFSSNYSVLTDAYPDDEKKEYYIRPIIPAHFYKFHFIFALAMFFFIALITVSQSQTARALLLLPVVLSYGIAHILFAADQAEMVRVMMERYKRRISKKQDG